MRPHPLVTFGVAAGLSALACSALLGIETLGNEPEPIDAAVRDTSVPDTSPVCTPFHAPDRPDAAADDGGVSFTVATNTISFAIDKPEAADIFYDIDGVCTCEIPGQESCVRPSAGSAGPLPETCDIDGGRDLSGNRALQLLTGIPGVGETTLETNVRDGKYGVVASVRGYNGTPNDPSVRVDLARSYGTWGVTDAGTQGSVPLREDGNDPWTYAPNTATDDGKLITSKFFDDAAYVRDGVLVAHFPLVPLSIQFLAEGTNDHNPLTLRMVDLVVSAKVQLVGNSYTLTGGRMAGRVTAADLPKVLSVWKDPLDTNLGLCPNSPLFGTLTDKVCQRLDVASTHADDGKTLPCKGLSFGVGFTAGPIKLVGQRDFPFAATTCFTPGKDDVTAPGSFACP